jgi:NADH:ubiquinone oxidoreductase subunit K
MLKFNLIAVYLKMSFLCEAQLKLKDSAEIFFNLIEKGQLLDIMSWVDSFFLFYFLFLIGLTGILFNYKNYLVTMFCIELMYLGITICFIIVSVATADPKGQIYAIILLVLAAAESAIGLGILIVLYRFGSSIDFKDYQELKG